jgi:2,5-furandicarboxylate decarboxylase 1
VEFRSLLRSLDAQGQLLRVEREVDPVYEVNAVIKRVQKTVNQPVLFEHVRGAQFPLVSNIFGQRRTVPYALEIAPEQLLAELTDRESRPLPTKRIENAAVQEVVQIGQDVCLDDIPFIVHTEGDAGRYITGGVLIARHPDTGASNASWNRVQVVDAEKLRVRMMPPQHLGRLHALAEAQERSLETAIVIGAPPALMFSAASKIPFEADELTVAGAWQGSPLEVTRCKTIDVDVPAGAEIVIEGEVLPGVREEEGPFGEFTDSFVPVMKNHVFRVKAVTRRHDPYYHTIFAGGEEDLRLLGVPIEQQVYKHVRQYVPDVVGISTTGFVFGCVIAIRKTNEDQPKNALLSALASYAWIKFVIVVDDDVDIHDADDVLWAIQTRCRPDTGVMLIPGVPSYTREDVRAVHSGKLGIDATLPLTHRQVSRRRHVPGADTLNLSDYFGEQFAPASGRAHTRSG